MAVIDLTTGKKTNKKPVQGFVVGDSVPPQPTQNKNPQGRIINLETGEFIEQAKQAPPELSPEKEMGFFESVGESITGNKRIEANPELEILPEFGSTPEGDTFKIAAGMLTTFNPEAQKDIIKSSIPDANFIDLDDGTTIVEVTAEDGSKKRSVLNRPGLSPQDITTGIAQMLAFVPAAKVASLGKTALQKIGFGAVASGTTEQLRQEAEIAQGSKQGRSPEDLLLAAGFGGISEAIAPLTKTARQITQRGQDIAERSAADVAKEATQRTGVELFPAQQTLNPTDIERQAFVSSLPEGAQVARSSLIKQNQQAADAVDQFLGQLAPPESMTSAAPRFRGAAQRALDAKKAIRKERTSPLYNAAFDAGADVNLKPVRDLIKSELDELPESGEMFKSINKVNTLIKNKIVDGVEQPPNLKRLHNAKLEIDQMLNKVGSDSLGNTTKAKLSAIKESLITEMQDASQLYSEAMEEFKRLSPAVSDIDDSIIGRIANFDDTQLKNIAQRVFDPSETNPAIIESAKKAISEVDPDAWNTLLRSELERRMGKIRSDIGDLSATGATENIPSQLFNSIFGNKKSRDILYKSLDTEQRKNLRYLETALRRATKGRPGGSQTAIREEIKRELRGGIFQPLRDFFKAPISTIAEIGEEAAFNERTRALATVMFDPAYKKELARLRELNPKSSEAMKLMKTLLNTSLKSLTPRTEQEQ